MKIEGELTGNLEIKRFYLEGLKITEKCPKCGKEIIHKTCLSYPEINGIEQIWFVCEDCDDYNFGKRIQVNISIIEVDDKILEYGE